MQLTLVLRVGAAPTARRRRITVGVHNLKMLMLEIVSGLRSLLFELPDWEIALGVDVLGKEKEWPVMGLTIRKNEIIDWLQRQYFPPEFKDLEYEGSRLGTRYD